MSKWVIDKQFSFCYGHRVHNQQLNGEFSDNLKCACRHNHGHEGLVHIFLEGDELTRGMVTDFRHLEWAKRFLDQHIDHQFIVDSHDPMFGHFIDNIYKDLTGKVVVPFKDVFVPGTNYIAGRIVDLSSVEHLSSTPDYEVLEGYFVVDFVPTSENLCKWLYDCVQSKMSKLNVKVAQIDWYETPRSRSSYRG